MAVEIAMLTKREIEDFKRSIVTDIVEALRVEIECTKEEILDEVDEMVESSVERILGSKQGKDVVEGCIIDNHDFEVIVKCKRVDENKAIIVQTDFNGQFSSEEMVATYETLGNHMMQHLTKLALE